MGSGFRESQREQLRLMLAVKSEDVDWCAWGEEACAFLTEHGVGGPLLCVYERYLSATPDDWHFDWAQYNADVLAWAKHHGLEDELVRLEASNA